MAVLFYTVGGRAADDGARIDFGKQILLDALVGTDGATAENEDERAKVGCEIVRVLAEMSEQITASHRPAPAALSAASDTKPKVV
jgi:hypothetical protein